MENINDSGELNELKRRLYPSNDFLRIQSFIYKYFKACKSHELSLNFQDSTLMYKLCPCYPISKIESKLFSIRLDVDLKKYINKKL